MTHACLAFGYSDHGCECEGLRPARPGRTGFSDHFMTEFRMAKQVGRVPSMVVPLDQEQQARFERLMDTITMIDMHQHPMLLTDDVSDLDAYFRGHAYGWGYDAVRHGGWTAVGTA